MKEIIKKVLKSEVFQSKMKTFFWQTSIGFIGLLGFFIEVLRPEVVDPKILLIMSATISGLNIISKYINKNYL